MTRRDEALPTVGKGSLMAVGLCIGSMLSFQLATGLSRPLVHDLGATAVTWIRMAAAAALLLAITRPALRGRSRQAVRSALMLGAALAVMSSAFFAAAALMPLGLVATIAFLGPLSVAVIGMPGRSGWLLAALAGAGVVLCLDPLSAAGVAGWSVNGTGLLLAATAAAAWAAYILLTRHVGQCFLGLEGLTFALVAAAIILTPFGLWSMRHPPSFPTVVSAAGLAILAPVLPCALEMAALRRIGTGSFGILMSMEPAIALALGFLLWAEVTGPLPVLGMSFVCLASLYAVRLRQGSDITRKERKD